MSSREERITCDSITRTSYPVIPEMPMPEPETNTRAITPPPPPRASQHNATNTEVTTTPERVRQVELNRLRGIINLIFLFLVPSLTRNITTHGNHFIFIITHSQGKTTRTRRRSLLFFFLAAQSQQQKTPRRRPRDLQLPDPPDEQQQREWECGQQRRKRKTAARFASREIL